VSRVDGFGATTAAEAGDALAPRDRIVAGAGGRAVLSLGAESRVTLEEKSAVRVLSLDQAGVKLELEGGRVQARIRPGAGSLGISADGREVIADDADFTAVRDAAGGALAIVAERGSVGITGVDGATRVNAGERLVSVPGGSALVAPAAQDLLLQVAWPQAERTREVMVTVQGHTEPGAHVALRANGVAAATVTADPAGSFSKKVALAEGRNEIEIVATSVLGTTTRVTHAFVRDTTAPSVGVEIHY
jgi:hypothetical protein